MFSNISLINSNTNINYNNLINKTWINSGTDIYNNNTGYVGIGTNKPESQLHIEKGEIFIGDHTKINSIYGVDNSYKLSFDKSL